MTASSRPDVPPNLDDYPHRLADNVRFADLDVNGHVNNAVYSTYFESNRVMLVKDPAHGLTPAGSSWVLVRLDIHFRAELHWPGQIVVGLGVAKLGRTSVTFAQAVFSGQRCIASAFATTVMVGKDTRKPTPLPNDVVANFRRWMIRGDAANERRA